MLRLRVIFKTERYPVAEMPDTAEKPPRRHGKCDGSRKVDVAVEVQAIGRMFGASGCNGEKCIFVYILHRCCFKLPVCVRILDYAQRVDPQVTEAHKAGQADYVLEGRGKIQEMYTALQSINVAIPKYDRKLTTPAVTQC